MGGGLVHATKCKNHPILVRSISYCHKFHQDSESVFKIFLRDSRSQRQPLPPERHPLLLRVALESSGGVTTLTLHTEIFRFLVRNNVSGLLNDFPMKKTKTNVGFILCLHVNKSAALKLTFCYLILPL